MGQLSFAVKMASQQIFTQEFALMNNLHVSYSSGEEYIL